MENKITIINEKKEEIECEILFTFDSDEYEKSYVLYTPLNVEETEGNVFVSSFLENENGTIGKLEDVESEEEWEMIEEMLNTFQEEEE